MLVVHTDYAADFAGVHVTFCGCLDSCFARARSQVTSVERVYAKIDPHAQYNALCFAHVCGWSHLVQVLGIRYIDPPSCLKSSGVCGAQGEELPHVQCPRLGTTGNDRRGKQEQICSQRNCHFCSLPPPTRYSTVREDNGVGRRRLRAYRTSRPQRILSCLMSKFALRSVSRFSTRLCVPNAFSLDAQEPSKADNGY